MFLKKKPSSFRKNIASVPCRKVPRAVVSDSASVVFDYIDMYSKLICTGAPETKMQCLNAAVLPPAETQRNMVNMFEQVSEDLAGNMAGLDGVFWKLIMLREMDALGDLATAVRTHNMSKEIIDNIVDYARQLPMDMLHGAINS